MFTFAALVIGTIVLTALASPLDAAEEGRQKALVSAEIGSGWLQLH